MMIIVFGRISMTFSSEFLEFKRMHALLVQFPKRRRHRPTCRHMQRLHHLIRCALSHITCIRCTDLWSVRNRFVKRSWNSRWRGPGYFIITFKGSWSAPALADRLRLQTHLHTRKQRRCWGLIHEMRAIHQPKPSTICVCKDIQGALWSWIDNRRVCWAIDRS